MSLTKYYFRAFGCCLLSLILYKKDLQAQHFSLANTLQSNMVVQQGEKLILWGKASPGQQVTALVSWQKGRLSAKANADSSWSLEVPVPTAIAGDFTRHRISVTAGREQMELTDILIGDLWLCGGQSNMDMTIKPFLPWLLGALHYQMEIENANYPQIRFFDVRTDFKSEEMQDCGGYWKRCNPANAPDFSAVAFFFAREMFNRRNIPIGMVTSALGGSSAQAWTSRDSLTGNSFLHNKYLADFDTSAAAKTAPDSVVTFEKVVMPSFLYNAMIYPLRNLRFSGILFYQGESNRHDSSAYTHLSATLVNNWRHLVSQPELPFYYVQVAPFHWDNFDTTAYNYAVFREAQADIRRIVPHTEMVVTMDISDPMDLHPRNKQEVGYRLAKIAMAKNYASSNEFAGPEYESHKIEGKLVKVKFKKQGVGAGLATNDGLAPRHFYLSGEDKKFYYANAKIVGDEVWLESDAVAKPLHLRYAFTNFPVTNFGNADGFPAIPFRTDKN